MWSSSPSFWCALGSFSLTHISSFYPSRVMRRHKKLNKHQKWYFSFSIYSSIVKIKLKLIIIKKFLCWCIFLRFPLKCFFLSCFGNFWLKDGKFNFPLRESRPGILQIITRKLFNFRRKLTLIWIFFFDQKGVTHR